MYQSRETIALPINCNMNLTRFFLYQTQQEKCTHIFITNILYCLRDSKRHHVLYKRHDSAILHLQSKGKKKATLGRFPHILRPAWKRSQNKLNPNNTINRQNQCQPPIGISNLVLCTEHQLHKPHRSEAHRNSWEKAKYPITSFQKGKQS